LKAFSFVFLKLKFTDALMPFLASDTGSGFFVLFCFLVVLGFELRAYTLIHSTSPFFVMVFFKIGSCELFAQSGFEPRSS
jgi:hypothetical protein